MGPIEQALREARERVKRGWCQGCSTVGDSDYCAMAAIAYAGAPPGTFDIMCSVIDHERITVWNDAPDRTQEHVIAAFGLAICRAKRANL